MTTSRLSTCSFMSCLMLLMLLSACYRKPVYPTMLTEADSAYVQGDYSLADSLLAVFDGQGDVTALAYRQYLGLTQKYVRAQLTDQDFSLADSLARLYNRRGTREKHARTLLFLGDIYRLTADNPSALNCFLQAETLGKQTGSLLLQAWACQHIGDTYFDQRMLDECKSYYRRFYQIAEARHDTLRMAHACERMGLVCTIENEIDSIIIYYKQAISFGQKLPQKADIVTVTKANLCDIYIQLEEFDEAAKIMPRDSVNAYNWAYWHLGQNHEDSAICYFTQMLGSCSLRSQAEYLRVLIQLETARGNTLKANEYYALLIKAEDSLKVVSQVEETRKTQAQFNYNMITQQRDKISKEKRQLAWLLLSALILALIICIVSVILIKRIKEHKEAEITKERLLRQEKESILRRNEQVIERSRQRQEELEHLLKEAKEQNNVQKTIELSHEAKMLAIQNQKIEAEQERQRLKIEEFRNSKLYRLLHHQIANAKYQLSNDDWQLLADTIDNIYEHFTSRLTSLAKLSSTDLKICYLLKAGVPPVDMSLLLLREKSTITKARKRMWTKLTGEPENSQKLDEFIRDF